MNLRKAEKNEFEAVRAMYWELIDEMRDAEFRPMWEKNVYPADEQLREAIERGELYVCETDGEIVASMILNHACAAEYAQVEWSVDAKPEEVTVIHALGVLPRYHGRGVSHFMVDSAIGIARENAQKAIRLDVLQGNLPAFRLYERHGFAMKKELTLFYEDTGWMSFSLYELVL